MPLIQAAWWAGTRVPAHQMAACGAPPQDWIRPRVSGTPAAEYPAEGTGQGVEKVGLRGLADGFGQDFGAQIGSEGSVGRGEVLGSGGVVGAVVPCWPPLADASARSL